jgi:hypothetical protein
MKQFRHEGCRCKRYKHCAGCGDHFTLSTAQDENKFCSIRCEGKAKTNGDKRGHRPVKRFSSAGAKKSATGQAYVGRSGGPRRDRGSLPAQVR